MANGSQTVSAVITADAKPFKRAVQDAGGSFDVFSNSIRTGALVAAGAIAAIGAVAVQVGRDAVKSATQYEDVAAALGQIFGEASKGLTDFAKQVPSLLGQSQVQFLEAVKSFGQFGQAAELAGEDNAAFAQQLAILATDLRSFNGGTLEDAISAIGSALRGEAEPIRRYGVFLDDATLKATAFEMGIYDGNGTLTAQQKILAANKEILKQTTTAQGDFIRTQDGMANSAELLNASFSDIVLVLGQELIPILAPLAQDMAAFINEAKESPEFQEFVKSLGDSFERVAESLKDVAPQIAELTTEFLPAFSYAVEIAADLLGDLSDIFAETNIEADGFSEWLDYVFTPLNFLLDLILLVASGFTEVGDSIQDVIDTWNNLWGVQQSKPLVGTPDSLERQLATPPRYSDDMRRPNTYNISVNAIAPTAEVGRAVVDSLQAYQRIGGRVA